MSKHLFLAFALFLILLPGMKCGATYPTDPGKCGLRAIECSDHGCCSDIYICGNGITCEFGTCCTPPYDGNHDWIQTKAPVPERYPGQDAGR
jgi:hypothetical protein